MSLIKHSTYNLIAALAPLVVGIITVPIYLQIIGVTKYGIMLIVFATLGYFGFLDLGLGNALTQKIARVGMGRMQRKQHIFTVAIAITSLLSIFGSIIAWVICNHIADFGNISSENSTFIKKYSIYVIGFIPVILFTSIFKGALQAESKFLELSIIQLFGNISVQVFPLIIAVCGYGDVENLILGILLCKTLALIFLIRKSNTFIKAKFNMNALRVHRHGLVSYGGYSSMISILTQFFTMFDRFIILGVSGAKAVALYSIPTEFFSKILIIPNSISTPLFTIAAENKNNEIRKLTSEITLTIVRITAPVILTLLLFGNEIIRFWVGSEIADNTHYVSLFYVVGMFFLIMAIPKHTEIMAINGPKLLFKCYLLELPFYILGLYFMVIKYGVSGAAFAWMIRVIIDAILILFISKSIKVVFYSSYKYLILVSIATILNILNISIYLKLISLLLFICSEIKFYKSIVYEYKNNLKDIFRA
jgi:O-antigen/teichoic acid export membrane protein